METWGNKVLKKVHAVDGSPLFDKNSLTKTIPFDKSVPPCYLMGNEEGKPSDRFSDA